MAAHRRRRADAGGYRRLSQLPHRVVAYRRYRSARITLAIIQAVRTASSPMIEVATANVAQANAVAAGCDSAMAQCPTTFAVDASGKLNTHVAIVKGWRT